MRWLAAVVLLCGSAALALQPDTRASALPAEARETLELVKAGGPFPYPRDGSVFGNREGLLPKRERGYYREYTVKTPGARDSGARRIVGGRCGHAGCMEYFYTDDHYRSFRRIIE